MDGKKNTTIFYRSLWTLRLEGHFCDHAAPPAVLIKQVCHLVAQMTLIREIPLAPYLKMRLIVRRIFQTQRKIVKGFPRGEGTPPAAAGQGRTVAAQPPASCLTASLDSHRRLALFVNTGKLLKRTAQRSGSSFHFQKDREFPNSPAKTGCWRPFPKCVS